MPGRTIVVLGAGSWGTALAILLSRQGQRVSLWGHQSTIVAAMATARENVRYLPGVRFPDPLEPISELTGPLDEPCDILIAVPSHAFRNVLRTIAPLLRPGSRIAWATKGLEPGSNLFLHQVLDEELKGAFPTAIISGPTFAREVAEGLPTAVTVASASAAFAQDLAQRLHDGAFRAYTGSDIVGVELGGAVKNVLAIAAGIADGLGFGANTRAALITRGLAELMRLSDAVGGQRETLMGLAGLGDLVLTCTDNQSRNRRFGLALGEGKSLEQARGSIDQVVEGIQTAREIYRLAQGLGVEMPISGQVYRVVYEGLSPRGAVRELLEREQKPESA